MKKYLFVFILSVLVLFGTVCTAAGQMMSRTGVARDNVFTYSYTCYFLSNDPNAVSPADFSWINQTVYYMMKITAVSGSTINYETTLHMLNGSNILGLGSMDIGSGMYSMSGFSPMGRNSFFFMSSNVGMMGKMFPSSSNSPTVNDTLMMSYTGGQRSINHFSMIVNQNGVNQSDYYFDQATGAMVEWHQQYIQNSGNLQTNSTQMMKLTSSSVWAIPELSIFIILPFLCIMVAVILTVKIKKNLFRI